MSWKKQPPYPSPLFARAQARPAPSKFPRTVVRVKSGQWKGATGEIAAVAQMEDDTLAMVVNIAWRGSVYRIAVDENCLELVENEKTRGQLYHATS